MTTELFLSPRTENLSCLLKVVIKSLTFWVIMNFGNMKAQCCSMQCRCNFSANQSLIIFISYNPDPPSIQNVAIECPTIKPFPNWLSHYIIFCKKNRKRNNHRRFHEFSSQFFLKLFLFYIVRTKNFLLRHENFVNL